MMQRLAAHGVIALELGHPWLFGRELLVTFVDYSWFLSSWDYAQLPDTFNIGNW